MLALEAGGYAEKFGNKYEANWVAYQLLMLLDEKISSVIVEPLGEDEVGVDVVIERTNGVKEYHQCKAGSANNEYWSLSQLNQAKILENAFYQINREGNEFHLVSPLTSKKLSDLCDSALNTNGNATEFYKYQIEISLQRKKDFSDLCDYLNLDDSKESDLEKAILFLQKFKITPYVLNKHTVCELEDKAVSLFSGSPSKLLSFLKNYTVESNKLRVKITASILLNDLVGNGFNPRIKPDDRRIAPVLDSISNDFTNSIRPYLISETIIPRIEIKAALDSLNSHSITLIKAEAGMGKSALMLELHERVQSQGAISVPIRLDRNRPENNADAFGEKLGFPYSPVLCMNRYSSQQKIVFILDQLDAIRWTATHSNNALQVCQELVRQVLSLRKEGVDVNVILACRDFDLDEDVALSNWINGLKDEVYEVKLSHLEESIVTNLIEPFEAFSTLSDEKKNILTIPLWLSIYLVIANRVKEAPKFSNKLELVKRFWSDRIGEVVSLGVSEESAKQLIDELVVLMNSKSRLTVSENIIEISSPKTLEALLSVGILSKQSHDISFRHQALFDFQVGKRLFNAALVSPEQLINEIGSFSHQTLTKREHLKYALNMILDYGQNEFCSSSLAILTSDRIRFHLKYLVFNSIKDLSVLKRSAREMLNLLALDSDLQSSFISISCFNNHHIIKSLSSSGIISGWLNSEDPYLIDKVVRLLRSSSEKDPHTVLKELSPFIGDTEEWNGRVYAGLCWDMERDTDEMFEVRKKLINLGCNAGYIRWKQLAISNPSRVLDLIEMLLYHHKEKLCDPYTYKKANNELMSRKDSWTEADLEDLIGLSLVIPEEILIRLLAIVNSFIGDEDDDDDSSNWFHKEYYSSYSSEVSLAKGVLSIIQSAGKNLSNSPSVLLDLVTPYLSCKNPVLTNVVAGLLNNLDVSYSNSVIIWLLEKQSVRLKCGDNHVEPEWILPGKLIEKFSPHCTDILFERLDKSIYYFSSSLSLEQKKWRLGARKEGDYYSYWGEAQYFLLPRLDAFRISIKSKELIGVLKRKFNKYTEDDFYSSFRSSGGVVTSPLPLGNVLSDRSWVNLILSPKERVNRKNWVQRSKGSLSESSVVQFSRSLDSAVRNQPERFARLALTLPSNIDKEYINGFYWGFTEKDENKVNEKYRSNWKVCTPELIEKVINHFDNSKCEYSLVRVLEKNFTVKGWSEKSMKLLIDIAINSEDPKVNRLNYRSSNESELASEASLDSIRGTSINCCRGIAYRAIGRLFWDDKHLAEELKYLIHYSIEDEHPAVNIAALDMLLPFINFDEDFAFNNFLLLCNKDLRMTCGHGADYFFNGAFESKYQSDFVLLVKKMLVSSFDAVKKEAARQVFARWFFNDLFHGEVDSIIEGEVLYREGVASVMAQFLSENKYHESMYKLPPMYLKLVNDENKDVLRLIGGCIRDDNYWNKSISTELFDLYVGSKAALSNLYDLFDSIEKHSGSLLPYQYQLLRLVENITSIDETNSSNRDLNIQESSLIKVVQRLYDEATEDEDGCAINICLDIWDKLLKSEIYSAINASKELEKGLLS